MDVKSTFINEDLKEEICVEQPSRFVLLGLEGKVFKLEKVL